MCSCFAGLLTEGRGGDSSSSSIRAAVNRLLAGGGGTLQGVYVVATANAVWSLDTAFLARSTQARNKLKISGGNT